MNKSNGNTKQTTEEMSPVERMCIYGHFNINLRIRDREASEKLKILCDVELSYEDDKTYEKLMGIVGTLKEFTSSRNLQMDFSNTVNQKYHKSNIGESLANVVSADFVKALYNNMTDENLGILNTAFKITNGKIQWVEKRKSLSEQAVAWAAEAMKHANIKMTNLPPREPTITNEVSGKDKTDEEVVNDILNQ